jgi:tetratricopeptide (TPR) repeat protein
MRRVINMFERMKVLLVLFSKASLLGVHFYQIVYGALTLRRSVMLEPDLDRRIRVYEEAPAGAAAHPEQVDELVKDCKRVLGDLIMEKRHDDAIALMERLMKLAPANPDLRRLAALGCGGKGEYIMSRADQLKVQPAGFVLDDMEALFLKAIAFDPSLPDPYWDMAVLKARFRNDLKEAARFYQQAKKMNYRHPMMPALEKMLYGG